MKQKFTVKKVPFATRKHLVEIADKGEDWDFNRQLCPVAIRQLPDDLELTYPVVLHSTHEHRHGEPCELHMRMMFTLPDDNAFADVPLEYFDSLPIGHVVLLEDELITILFENEDGTPWKLGYFIWNRHTRRAVKHLLKKTKNQQTKEFLEGFLLETIDLAA